MFYYPRKMGWNSRVFFRISILPALRNRILTPILMYFVILQKRGGIHEFRNISIYYINKSEIPSELSRENFISSHVKSRLFHQKKQNIKCPLVDMNFIFSCSTRYPVTRSLVRVEHSKKKFLSMRGHVISSIMVATGQEIVREKKILQGQGKVREFHFESGKIYIFEKSQGKVKF